MGFLMYAGASLSIRDKRGKTALDFAYEGLHRVDDTNHARTIEMLTKAGDQKNTMCIKYIVKNILFDLKNIYFFHF